jgi:hypothetical protein
MLRTVGAAMALLLLTAFAGGCSTDSDRPDARPVARRSILHAYGTTGRNHTYFVAPNGHDSNPGSRRAPFRTFTKALAVLRAGDALYARGGTYDERVKATRIASGSPTARVLVANFPHERPVIRGELWLAYPSYWTIDGINVTWGPTNPDEHMVNIYGGTDWVLEHSEIWGARSYADLLIGDGRRNNLGLFTVRDNCIHDTRPTNGRYQDHNIYIDDTTHSSFAQGLIEHNLIFGAYNGRNLKLGPPGGSGGPRNVVVRYNTMYGAYQGVSFSRDASNNAVYRNLLVGAADANIGTYRLQGSGNRVGDNLAFRSPRFADAGFGVDLSGNRHPLDPQFDSIGCSGFHPMNPSARAYGRYANTR